MVRLHVRWLSGFRCPRLPVSPCPIGPEPDGHVPRDNGEGSNPFTRFLAQVAGRLRVFVPDPRGNVPSVSFEVTVPRMPLSGVVSRMSQRLVPSTRTGIDPPLAGRPPRLLLRSSGAPTFRSADRAFEAMSLKLHTPTDAERSRRMAQAVARIDRSLVASEPIPRRATAQDLEQHTG